MADRRMPVREKFSRLSLTNKVVVITSISGVLIGSLVGLVAFLSWRYPQSPAPYIPAEDTNVIPAEITSVEPIPMRVNKKYAPSADGIGEVLSNTEIAVVRVKVLNKSEDHSLSLRRGELLLDDVERVTYGLTTSMFVLLSDELDIDCQVLVDDPEVGDSVLFQIGTSLEPLTSQVFTIWFRPAAPLFERREILRLSGRLRIHSDKGAITSEPFKLELHGEIKQREPETTDVPYRVPLAPHPSPL